MTSPALAREIAWTDGGFEALPGVRMESLRQENMRPVDAVPTPFPTWNLACRDAGGGMGPARGWHVTIGARTGKGKSLAALNLAAAAVRAGEQVTFVSLEMSRVQVETRFLAIATGTPIRRLERGKSFDAPAYDEAAAKLEAMTEAEGGAFAVNERPITRLDDVEAAIRFQHERFGSRYFIVDYLQLAARNPNDAAEITAVSHAVRGLAVELDVVTVGISQFNRQDHRERPTIYGLMGASAIENDSDQVVLIDHTRTERSPAPVEGWDTFLMLAKNRHGPVTELPVRFDSRTLGLTEVMPDELPSERRG